MNTSVHINLLYCEQYAGRAAYCS